MRPYVLGDAMTIVTHDYKQRQIHSLGAAGNSDSHAMLEARGQDDFGVADAFLRHRLGGVLDQIEHDLDQLVAIGPNRRQRRIIEFLKAYMGGKAGLSQPSDVLQY